MILKVINKVIIFVFFISFVQLHGQGITYNGNPDTSFETARKLAFNEHRKDAQDTLRNILTKYPNYHEIRTFLATTYSWDGNYKKARKEFSYALEKDSKNKNNWIPAIKNELWADAPHDALELSNKALEIFPNDPDILYLKASAQENTNNPIEALKTVETILDKNPEDKKAKDFKNSLNQKLRNYSIGIKSSVDLYSEVFDPMQYYTLNLSRNTKYGSIIAKYNFNRRFNENGSQFEVDLYPKITKGLYAYLNLGLSKSFLFPSVRYGGEFINRQVVPMPKWRRSTVLPMPKGRPLM
jgi:tetratricopeptide (TPR) repeat protein